MTFAAVALLGILATIGSAALLLCCDDAPLPPYDMHAGRKEMR